MSIAQFVFLRYGKPAFNCGNAATVLSAGQVSWRVQTKTSPVFICVLFLFYSINCTKTKQIDYIYAKDKEINDIL